MTSSHSQNARQHKRRDKGLVLIAAYKLLVALIFAIVGVGALRLIGRDVDNLLASLVSDLHFPESRFINFLIDKASLIDDHMLRRIGVGAFGYSGLSLLEAVGLYLEKAWGEYLTLLITASFLPLEIRELVHHFTWLRIGIFVVNLGVFVYLLLIVVERRKKAGPAEESAGNPVA
jgi:uncharacterized membrane protein (DUF2068 family)